MARREAGEEYARLLLDQPKLAMRLLLRFSFIAAGISAATVAAGLTLRVPAAVELWPWADTPLSFAFLGAVVAALAAGSLWVGLTGQFRAAVISLFGLFLICAASAGYLFWLDLQRGTETLAVQTRIMGGAALFALALLVIARGGDPEPRLMGWLPRVSCIIYGLVLAGIGWALTDQRYDVFPWPLQPETSVVFGILFAGLGVVYLLTAWSGDRRAGMVVMLGFLAYDILLLPRLVPLFPTIDPDRLLSLAAYCAVLGYSAVIAVDYLLFDGRRAARDAADDDDEEG